MIAHQYYSCMCLCNLIRNVKKNRPFPGSSKGQVSASVFEDHRLRRTIDYTAYMGLETRSRAPQSRIVTPLKHSPEYLATCRIKDPRCSSGVIASMAKIKSDGHLSTKSGNNFLFLPELYIE